MKIKRINILGAILANAINLSTILVFIFRLLEKPNIGHWIGIIIQLSIFPLIYLLYTASQFNRRKIYYLWIGLMIVFVIVEFLLDWYPTVDFRNNLSIVIPYVMLFFGATGGMIGVASYAGKGWTIMTVSTFLIVFILAFIQRAVTGM